VGKCLHHFFLVCHIINLSRTAAIIRSKTQSGMVAPATPSKIVQRTIFQPKAEVTRIASCSLQYDLNLVLKAKRRDNQCIDVYLFLVKLLCSCALKCVRIQTEPEFHDIGVDLP